MILDPENAQHLKPWLIRTLEPICDAEPGALADYVLALLKHNGPESELRKEMHAQLDEFLEKECKPFLDTLFTALRTKSYLPYSAATSSGAPSDAGIPIPLDALLPSAPTSPRQSRKRALEEEERNGQNPAKMPRTNAGDGPYSRYPVYPGEERPSGGWRERQRLAAHGPDDASNQNGRVYAPPEHPKRGICRDYHNTGYCGRGAYCKYSHDDSAMVPSQMFAMHGGGMPFMPMFPGQPYGGGVNPVAAYDPHEAQVDMRPPNGGLPPHGRPGPGPRPDTRSLRSGELPVIQDLTPNVPPTDLQPNPNARLLGNAAPVPAPVPVYHPDTRRMDSPNMAMQVDVESFRPPRSQPQNGLRYGNRGPARPGTFPSEAANFRPTERRKDKTLVMEKIPEDKLSLESVNDWFKRFGTVTNVAIDRPSSKALISFSTHEEAHAAWKSEDAVFNNRFVKLFWHRPLEGHGQLGSKMLAASAPVVAHLSAPTPPPVETPQPAAGPSTRPTPVKKPATPSAAAASLAAKQQLLEKQIAEQKELMSSLEKATGQEKKDIMARLRKLSEEMTAAKAAEKEPTPEASLSPVGEGSSESAQDLKAKLERLKAEAASLGISETGAPNYAPRPYRGRGARGARALYRGGGRGGPPRGSLKLDNRPKRLLVKGVDPANIQALQDWYETTGQVESVTKQDDGDVVVAFNSREAAEQGLGKGSNIPAVGTVQISWMTGPAPAPRPAPAPKATPTPATEDVEMPDNAKARDATPRRTQDEEEEIASGWGGDGEDGMGML